jgi:hypothetical protein
MHSITRDARGRFVPVVRPKRWNASSLVRSRERSDRIATARMERKKTLTTTQWLQGLDRRAIAELEATGIPWAAVQRWLDEVHPSQAFMSRMFLKQILQVLSDDQAAPRERSEARRELYQRLIAAGIVD